MSDFATYDGTPGPIAKGDLLIDPAMNDLEVETDDRVNILREVIEAFDMKPADDIDSPEIYSRQREMLGADTRADALSRIQDARRILALIAGVDAKGSKIWIDDQGRLVLQIKLTDGRVISEIYR